MRVRLLATNLLYTFHKNSFYNKRYFRKSAIAQFQPVYKWKIIFYQILGAPSTPTPTSPASSKAAASLETKQLNDEIRTLKGQSFSLFFYSLILAQKQIRTELQKCFMCIIDCLSENDYNFY